MNDPLLPCPFCGVVPNKRLGGTGHNELDIYFNVPHVRECILYQTYGQILNKLDWNKWQKRTPPPASMKWPAPKVPVTESGVPVGLNYFNNGWNKCLKACKELNAVKETTNNDAR